MATVTPDQRNAQFDSVEKALANCKSLRLAADSAALKTNADAVALPALKNAYIAAVQAFNSGTGTGSEVDRTKAAYFAVANEAGAHMTEAQQAIVAFDTAWETLKDNVQALLTDPGAVEQV